MVYTALDRSNSTSAVICFLSIASSILSVSRMFKVSVELRLSNQWAGLPSMAAILIEKNLRLLGRVTCIGWIITDYRRSLYFQLCLAMHNQ